MRENPESLPTKSKGFCSVSTASYVHEGKYFSPYKNSIRPVNWGSTTDSTFLNGAYNNIVPIGIKQIYHDSCTTEFVVTG
jgi:hypothetical protein